MARTDFHKVMLGRAELLHIMDYAIADIPAKVDTGAYRSAVHADNIEVSDDGKTLSFRLLGGHPVCGKLATVITTPDFNKIMVTSSFGHQEERYSVNLRVKLGPKIFTTTFSLADRSKKVYPVLLGRKLLNGRFVVDTAFTQVYRSDLKQQLGIDFPADVDKKEEPES